MSHKIDTPIDKVKGVQARFLPHIKKLGIKTVRDLVMHFPVRYEDWREISPIAELTPGDKGAIQGTIQEINQTKSWQKKMIITEALIGDETGSIRAVWFNQPYIGQMLKKGVLVNITGKISIPKASAKGGPASGGKKAPYFSNPAYEIISKNTPEPKHTARIISIYPETRGLTSKGIRFMMKNALDVMDDIPEFIPQGILNELKLPEINDALLKIHLPENTKDAQPARKRFAFEDLFFLQLKNVQEKSLLKKQKAHVISHTDEDLKKLFLKLPFTLTSSQRKSLMEILRDMSFPHPMNRLLQGDVGSGKTIVAGIAAFIGADKPNKLQTAFMAPTELLARQHYKTLTTIFDNFTGGIGLLVAKEARVFYGDRPEEKTTKADLQKSISSGKLKVIIGTHALIQKNVKFKNLGLVVIDEQHRFGVKQRAQLVRKVEGAGDVGNKQVRQITSRRSNNSNILAPHFLSMSATPIPRTLMMSIFGNLDLSLITELPAGRRPIITKIVDPKNRDKAYAFIRGEVQKGRQVYVVCPRIEKVGENSMTKSGVLHSIARTSPWDALGDDVKAVEEEYEKLSKKVFPDLRVVMLHGKLKSEEKVNVMKDFSNGNSDLIVSTSVIEVGVDIPNATIMMIENAERFGLAQLYQFRGRVGRGEHQSFCFLFTESSSATTGKRLDSLLTAKNSFELAEKDLEIRGPGEFLGVTQSGMPDIAMTAIQNPKLLEVAKEKAEELLKKDPELKTYPELIKRLEIFQQEIHLE